MENILEQSIAIALDGIIWNILDFIRFMRGLEKMRMRDGIKNILEPSFLPLENYYIFL